MENKNLKLIFVCLFMFISMSVFVSADSVFTDYFNRTDEFQVNSENWISTNFIQQSGFYTRDQFIDNEKLGTINHGNLNPDESSVVYYNRDLYLPINITFLYGWEGGSSAGYTYPGINNVYYNTFSNPVVPNRFAVVGIGLDTLNDTFEKSNTNIYAEFRNDDSGIYLYLNGQKIGFNSNFTSHTYGDKYDACWNCDAGSNGFAGANQTPNYLNIYINESFIGLKSWDVTESEPATYQVSNSSVSVSTNAFYNTKFFTGLSDDAITASYFIDNFTITEGLNQTECVINPNPTYTECGSLAGDYISNQNLCTESEIIECYELIDQQAENIQCTWSVTPTQSECSNIYSEYQVGNNDCNIFFYQACVLDIPEDTDTIEEIESGIPNIFNKLQENIKFIFAIALIIGLITLVASYTQNSLILIFVGILGTILSVVLGLISAKYLIYIIISLIVIIILAIIFGHRTKE